MLNPERVGGGKSVPGSYFLDSKSGGQKICYPNYRTANARNRFPKKIAHIAFF